MSAAFVPSWPGSRVLLGWWRELSRYKPQQVWLSRLLIHRVEALVRVGCSRPLDSWHRALLSLASSRVPCGGELINSLNDLKMDTQMLGQLVRELIENGFVQRNGSGLWQMTPAGRQALDTGALALEVEERRTFSFVDNTALGRTLHFLPLELGPARLAEPPLSEPAGGSFQPAFLEACIRQSDEWKRSYRFPADVKELLPPRSEETPASAWRRVILDVVEERLFVFIHKEQQSMTPHLLGFPVRTEGWVLGSEPLLELSEGGEEALPDVTAEPSAELWRQSWQTWAQPRGLPLADVEACRLERSDHRLLVHAPTRLIERLRAARSDAVKHEAWVLAGEGRSRSAAQIELHPL